MIIVEGPDGAGKSTLVRNLLDSFPLLREGVRGTTNRDKLYTVTVSDTFKALNHAIEARAGHSFIWDRLFYSELVYYKITSPERKCEFNPGQRRLINELIETLQAPIILCMPPAEIVIENALKDRQMEGVREKISQIYLDYANLYRWMPAHALWYDYTQDDEGRPRRAVAEYFERRKEREW